MLAGRNIYKYHGPHENDPSSEPAWSEVSHQDHYYPNDPSPEDLYKNIHVRIILTDRAVMMKTLRRLWRVTLMNMIRVTLPKDPS